jgi:hypothetical protein
MIENNEWKMLVVCVCKWERLVGAAMLKSVWEKDAV